MNRLRLTVLGCGSSPGVPRINGDWGACDPGNPKNRRLRSSAMLEQIDPSGDTTRVVIDTSPDFREQMITTGVEQLDAVVYTHAHADHIHGIDDLRSYVMNRKRLMDLYADAETHHRLMQAFGYCFVTPPNGTYPPIAQARLIDHETRFQIDGAGGPMTLLPLPQVHGDILSLGFRIGNIAYCSDVSALPDATVEKMQNLEILVIDALQYRRHPSHFSLEETLHWIEELKPTKAYLTHMHIPLDYETVLKETPDHVQPCFDGMVIEVTL